MVANGSAKLRWAARGFARACIELADHDLIRGLRGGDTRKERTIQRLELLTHTFHKIPVLLGSQSVEGREYVGQAGQQEWHKCREAVGTHLPAVGDVSRCRGDCPP
eukprot:scaffold8001_cov125-Isochrysis_galbana.AAC.12